MAIDNPQVPTPPAEAGSSQTSAEALYVPAGHSFRSVTEKISALVLARGTGKGWLGLFTIATALSMLFLAVVAYLLVEGVGIWGIDIPVAWGFAITSFVWW